MKTQKQTMVREEVTLHHLLLVLFDILAVLRPQSISDLQYYDNADLKRLLNVSDRTLQRYRKAKLLPFFKIHGKIYYPRSYFNQDLKL